MNKTDRALAELGSSLQIEATLQSRELNANNQKNQNGKQDHHQ